MSSLVTEKGRYETGEPIALRLSLDGTAADRAEVVVTRLQHQLYRFPLSLTGDETPFCLPPVAEGGACFGVTVLLTNGGQAAGRASTAVNVGGAVLRYGFLSDFLPEGDEDVAALAKYHIDHVQFYDWSYRHDTLVADTDEYADMMGKRASLPAIRAKIDACHARGMRCMAYGAVYAASRAYRDAHPQQGLYAGGERPLVFIDTFYYMDIESAWRERLFDQYAQAMARVGFDGIHMDTYGEPKRALGYDGTPRDLGAALPALIHDADAALRKRGLSPRLIFNNVGAWPVEATRYIPQAAVYMELWPPMEHLRHLRQAARVAAEVGKPVVLAAYPAPFRTDTPERALVGQCITSFAIALAGATQLFLGERDAVTTQGYYADYTALMPWQAERVKAYQDFFVRYQELLFDRTLTDVSMTHFGWDNQEYRCDQPCSVEGEPDMLWLTFRENATRKLVGLINLHGVGDDRWNTGKEPPTPQAHITLRMLLLHPVQTAWYATPDSNLGEAVALPCVCTQTPLGVEAAVTIPQLECCGLLWLDGQ
jgi:dextranase